MNQNQTTITYRGKKYPFYRTNRALMNFQNAGYTQEQLASGSIEALLALSYYILTDCARRAGNPISDDFDTFIDNSDDTILGAFSKINQAPGEVKETPTQETDIADDFSASMSK